MKLYSVHYRVRRFGWIAVSDVPNPFIYYVCYFVVPEALGTENGRAAAQHNLVMRFLETNLVNEAEIFSIEHVRDMPFGSWTTAPARTSAADATKKTEVA